jgi:hypothetical protein
VTRWLGLLLLLATGAAYADGGTVRIREEAGAFRITVFSAPEPLRAGNADLSVFLQRRDSETPVLDANIVIQLAGPPPAAPIQARATRDAATNKWFHAALVEIPSAGIWTLRVTVQSGADTAEVTGRMLVAPRTPPLLALWPYLALPPLAVGAFALREWLRRRRAPLRPPAPPPSRGDGGVAPRR